MKHDSFRDFSPLADNEPNRLEFLSGRDSLSVDRLGARISLRLGGIQILNSFNAKRFDGKPATTHPCSPNFGPFGSEYGLPQHGPVRGESLKIGEYRPELNGGKLSLSTQIETGIYPEGIVFK